VGLREDHTCNRGTTITLVGGVFNSSDQIVFIGGTGEPPVCANVVIISPCEVQCESHRERWRQWPAGPAAAAAGR
jgi:hypothetical protein